MQGTAEKCRRRWKASAPWEHLTRLSCCKMDLELAPGEQGLDGGPPLLEHQGPVGCSAESPSACLLIRGSWEITQSACEVT